MLATQANYLGEAIEENPKPFWSYIKQLNKEELGVAGFEINGSIISDNKSKADTQTENGKKNEA